MDQAAIGYTAAFLAGLFFGLSDVLVRAASLKLTPLQNLHISLIVGTPILWIAAIAAGGSPPSTEGLALYVLAGVLNFVLGRLVFYTAISYAGAAAAAIATSPTTVFAALLGWVFLGETLGPEDIAGITLVLLAIYLTYNKPSGEALHGGHGSTGVLLGVISAFIFALSTLVVRKASGYIGSDPLYGAAISYTTALPLVALYNRSLTPWRGLDRRHLGYMAVAAIVVSLAQISRYLSLSLVEIVDASILMALFPIHTLLFTRLLPGELEEKPTAVHGVAAALAFTGITLVILY